MTSAMLSRGYWSHNCGGIIVRRTPQKVMRLHKNRIFVHICVRYRNSGPSL
jgi:hypothetical protein